MKAKQYLEDMNISLGQARAFIQSNLSTPEFLLQVLEDYQISNDMVGEIMGNLPPGQIVRFFAQNGLDSSILDQFQTDDDVVEDDEETEEEDSGFGSDAVELTVNSNLDADISVAMETDLYSIELIEGESYTFTVTSDALTAPYLVLRDDDGDRIASDYQTLEESEASFSFIASDSGTFYLDLSDLNDDVTGVYNLSFTSDSIVVDDFSADTSTTGTITVDGDSASGTLEVGGDADWFAVTLNAETTYDIALESDDLNDASLVVYDADGVIVPDLAELDGDGVLSFTADAEGLYFVEVSDGDADTTGAYLVGVQVQEEVIA